MIAFLPLLPFAAIGVGSALLIAFRYRRTRPGTALVVHRTEVSHVARNGALVLPWIHTAHEVDLSVQSVHIACTGRQGLLCADDIRADVELTIHVRVNDTSDDILKAFHRFAGDIGRSDEHMHTVVTDALRQVVRRVEFDALTDRIDQVLDEVCTVVGADHHGLVLDQLTATSVGQTPIDVLDPNDLVDAKTIRAVTERVTAAQLATLALKRQHAVADADHTYRRKLAELEAQTHAAQHGQPSQQPDVLPAAHPTKTREV